MKRFMTEEEREVEGARLANLLMLLSKGAAGAVAGHGQQPPARLFECKTCSRQFPSFQALGGHRASHKKPRLAGDGRAQTQQARVHECSVCGLAFPMGQALGGHMRRHRAASDGFPQAPVEEKPGCGEKRGVLCLDLDLNLPPSEKDADFGMLKLELGLPVVDCFH